MPSVISRTIDAGTPAILWTDDFAALAGRFSFTGWGNDSTFNGIGFVARVDGGRLQVSVDGNDPWQDLGEVAQTTLLGVPAAPPAAPLVLVFYKGWFVPAQLLSVHSSVTPSDPRTFAFVRLAV